MDNIQLSICVTTYNRWPSVLLTLTSLVGIKNTSVEIIVVDDCSSSAPPEEFTELIKNHSIQFIRHSENKGLAAARNTAIKVAEGKYFTFCDDDDQWHPDAIELVLSSIEKNAPEMLIAQSGDLKTIIYPEEVKNLQDLFLLGVTPPVGSQVYLLSLIKSVGGYCENIKSGVDHDLWIRIVIKKNIEVRIFFGLIAIPNTNNDLDRMTLNVRRRMEGINRSLRIWKDDLVNTFGIDFYKHFANEYRYHIKKKFFLSAIKRNDLSYLLSDMKYIVFEFGFYRHFLELLGLKKKVSSFRPFKGVLND
jgi:glycosyltransferase involved in cell wall biosynthesis